MLRASKKPPISLESSLVQDDLPCKVIHGIYIGSVHSAFNSDALGKCEITHILNATGVPSVFPELFTYFNLSLHDNESANLLACLPAAFTFIETALEEGTGVLVHCSGGRSRSASLVIAYLMSKLKLTFEDAFARVRAARPVIQLNQGFEMQLQAYEDQACDVYRAHQQVLRIRLHSFAELRRQGSTRVSTKEADKQNVSYNQSATWEIYSFHSPEQERQKDQRQPHPGQSTDCEQSKRQQHQPYVKEVGMRKVWRERLVMSSTKGVPRHSPYPHHIHTVFSKRERRSRASPLRGFNADNSGSPSFHFVQRSGGTVTYRSDSKEEACEEDCNIRDFEDTGRIFFSKPILPVVGKSPEVATIRDPVNLQPALMPPSSFGETQKIPHLQAFERGLHCAACFTRLFKLGNVLITESSEGEDDQELQLTEGLRSLEAVEPDEPRNEKRCLFASVQKEDKQKDKEKVEQRNDFEDWKAKEKVGMTEWEEMQGVHEESGEENDVATVNSAKNRVASLDDEKCFHFSHGCNDDSRRVEDLTHACTSNQSSVPPSSPHSDVSRSTSLTMAAAATVVAASFSRRKHPKRLPSPLPDVLRAESPHPPPAPSHHRFVMECGHNATYKMSPWLYSPVSSDIPTPLHALDKAEGLTMSPISSPCVDEAPESTPISPGSFSNLTRTQVPSQVWACMRILEGSKGMGERTLAIIQADELACRRFRTCQNRWILVEVLPWMHSIVNEAEKGILLCPVMHCRAEIGRWDWSERVPIGRSANKSDGDCREATGERVIDRSAKAPSNSTTLAHKHAVKSSQQLPFIGFDSSKIVIAATT